MAIGMNEQRQFHQTIDSFMRGLDKVCDCTWSIGVTDKTYSSWKIPFRLYLKITKFQIRTHDLGLFVTYLDSRCKKWYFSELMLNTENISGVVNITMNEFDTELLLQ